MFIMLLDSVNTKAHTRLGCHQNAPIVMIDAWTIDSMFYEGVAMCSQCHRRVYIDLTKKEYMSLEP